MASNSRNLSRIFDREALGVGTHRRVVEVAGWTDCAFRWVMHVGAAGANAATISFYSSEFLLGDREIDDLNPTTNPFWGLESAAAFAKNPGTAIESDVLGLYENQYGTIMIQVVVTTALPSFSLVMRGQDRG